MLHIRGIWAQVGTESKTCNQFIAFWFHELRHRRLQGLLHRVNLQRLTEAVSLAAVVRAGWEPVLAVIQAQAQLPGRTVNANIHSTEVVI
jgi:hypothetical protein